MICMFKVVHYYLQMYLKILGINVLKYMKLIMFTFICTWISMASMFKKDWNKIRDINRYRYVVTGRKWN